ncbi:MAG TPA: sulfite exporter TauE/SafE family protein [Burkholderiales bacterium]|nr:sulfite exporter TauE/SafE family protein [Burkholderiales bacterium]
MKLFRHGPAAEGEAELTVDILGPVSVSSDGAASSEFPVLRTAVISTFLVLAALMAYLISTLIRNYELSGAMALVESTLHNPMFWSAVAVGLLAQAIDGALGMAYGVTSTTFLLTAGATPASASASVHIAELFTTGVSGVSHARMGNVDKRLFLRLLVPGIIGAILGVVFVTQIDVKALRPFISAYLVIMGLYILLKAWRALHPREKKAPKHVAKLALFGGFVDASGGGGWGPVVTSTLISRGNDVRTTIGSVNFAEFFIALATAGSFALLAGTGVWVLVAGLVLGGLFAAPFAAVMTRYLNARVLMVSVGLLVTVVSSYGLYKSLLA